MNTNAVDQIIEQSLLQPVHAGPLVLTVESEAEAMEYIATLCIRKGWVGERFSDKLLAVRHADGRLNVDGYVFDHSTQGTHRFRLEVRGERYTAKLPTAPVLDTPPPTGGLRLYSGLAAEVEQLTKAQYGLALGIKEQEVYFPPLSDDFFQADKSRLEQVCSHRRYARGRVLTDWDNPRDVAEHHLTSHLGKSDEVQRAVEDLEGQISRGELGAGGNVVYWEAARLLRAGEVRAMGGRGVVYAADVACAKERFLDTSLPIYQQSDSVKDSLRTFGFISDDPRTGSQIYHRIGRERAAESGSAGGPLLSSSEIAKLLTGAGIAGVRFPEPAHPTGREVSGGRLVQIEAEPGMPGTWRARTQISLCQHGRPAGGEIVVSERIHGWDNILQWVDEMLTPTRYNYLVFDPQNVTITHKNGVAVPQPAVNEADMQAMLGHLEAVARLDRPSDRRMGATQWLRAGFTPPEARLYLSSGVDDVVKAMELRTAGISGEDAKLEHSTPTGGTECLGYKYQRGLLTLPQVVAATPPLREVKQAAQMTADPYLTTDRVTATPGTPTL